MADKIESLCYSSTTNDAYSDYCSTSKFSTMIEVIMEKEHVQAVQDVMRDFLQIEVPEDYVVKMLSCNSYIATGAWEVYLIDTDVRSEIMNFLAEDLLGVHWPSGATSQDDTDKFFSKWRSKIISLDWADEDYEYGISWL